MGCRLFNVGSSTSLIVTHTNCVCIGDADIMLFLTPKFVFASPLWKRVRHQIEALTQHAECSQCG